MEFIKQVIKNRKLINNNDDEIVKKYKDIAKLKKEEVLEIIVKLRSRKLSNFELDRQLYEAINEFNKYKETCEPLKNSETFLKIELGLFESESEIVAARKYYNDIITDYNKLVRRFPSNIVAKLSGYKLKTYFDGKDMNDEIIKDFKL